MTREELVEQRKALIAEIDTADENRLNELETELRKNSLKLVEVSEEKSKEEEERAARSQNCTESRNASQVVLFDDTQDATPTMANKTQLRTAKIAFGKMVRASLQNTKPNLSAVEKRALGVSVTTTSSTFAEPSASANGVNNGGVFIPQSVLYDLLEIDPADSPFLRDVKLKQIIGAVIFPYVEEASNGSTKSKAETKAADDRAIKWGKLTLAQGNYPLTIEVTMELLAMTDEEFTNYLLADLANEMNLLLSSEVFYGSGVNNQLSGVTVEATAGTYVAGKEAEAIKNGLLALSKRARKGAKVYISRSLSLDLAFEKDSTGRYIFPIYNNAGIEQIATVPVEVDENLNDGDFVVGNPQNYILNIVKPTEVYTEVHGKTRIIEYTAHLMVAGKAPKNKFYYGKKATA